MKYARMMEGHVLEVIEPFFGEDGQEVPIGDRFPPDIVAQLVPYDPENPPVPPVEPAPSVEDRIRVLRARIASHLDAAAQAKNYDSIITAALRAAYPGPYHDEGVAFATWMDACWSAAYALLAQWSAGELEEPSPEELIAMLPTLNLPE